MRGRKVQLNKTRLSRLYHRFDGQVSAVAEHVNGVDYDTVRNHLIRAGIHDPDTGRRHGVGVDLQDLGPADVGLSPLRCAECRAQLEDGHPCPECGHDPTEGRPGRSNPHAKGGEH